MTNTKNEGGTVTRLQKAKFQIPCSDFKLKALTSKPFCCTGVSLPCFYVEKL